MKKYKVWLHVEELDDEAGEYRDIEEHTCSIGPEFNTEEAAAELIENLIDHTTVLWKINKDNHGKTKRIKQ